VAPGSVDTVLSYCHFTLNDRSLGELIPYLQNQGVGIINASVLSMGLLTPQV
jgi:L-galactose dehydrogenase